MQYRVWFCPKFQVDLIYGFTDIAIFIFQEFWLKTAYLRPCLGVLGRSPTHDVNIALTAKVTSLRGKPLFET